jgi:hypothetical protein
VPLLLQEGTQEAWPHAPQLVRSACSAGSKWLPNRSIKNAQRSKCYHTISSADCVTAFAALWVRDASADNRLPFCCGAGALI